MPSPEQILAGLKAIANSWTVLAIVWHVYFGAIIAAVVFGALPKKRPTAFLLVPPLVSVSAAAWNFGNPFNGVVFALIAVLAVVIGIKMQCRKAELAPVWSLLPGVAMFLFGWAYPHFLETSSFVPYLSSAPTGLIPCPTLSIAIGLVLILNGLGSFAFSLLLGIAGLFYGFIGVFRLQVGIDAVLITGAAVLLVRAFTLKPPRYNSAS
jgi:hypothetical protein